MMDSLFMTYNSTDQGDSSSAEDVESPRSVVSAASARRRCGGGRRRMSRHRNQLNNLNVNETSSNSNHNEKKCYLHSQVLRIREEEMQIEEDLIGDFGIFDVVYVVDSNPIDDASSKIILPASPLGTKKNC